MGTYINIASVRRTLGIDSSQISDDDVESFISEIESLVPRYFNTQFSMFETIDVLDGDGSDRIVLRNNPVWAVRELISDTVTETPSNLIISRESGRVVLSTTSIVSRFPNKRNIIRARYIYGKLDYDLTKTAKTTVASSAGTNVTLSVSSSSSFTNGDWVEIKGMDGYYEAAQITATGTGTITVDQLVYSHVLGSIVTKLITSQIFTRIMNVICSIALINRMLGNSANTESAYTLGELNATMQVPNQLWRETYNQFVTERDELMKRIKIRPGII